MFHWGGGMKFWCVFHGFLPLRKKKLKEDFSDADGDANQRIHLCGLTNINTIFEIVRIGISLIRPFMKFNNRLTNPHLKFQLMYNLPQSGLKVPPTPKFYNDNAAILSNNARCFVIFLSRHETLLSMVYYEIGPVSQFEC